MFIKLLKFLFGRRSSTKYHPQSKRRRSNFQWKPPKKWNPVTPSQIEYLNILIEINNSYRASPLTFEQWKSVYAGQLYFWSAKKLIEKIKSENVEKRLIFGQKIANRFDRKNLKTIFASDFSAHGFCTNSFYLSYRGYASKNIYELSAGQMYHGEFSKTKEYVNKSTEFLKKNINGIRAVKWFKASEDESLYYSKLNISGLADGIIFFENKSQAVVEVKTKKSALPNEAYWGDILQACAYRKIYDHNREIDSPVMSSNVFIIYRNRESGQQRLFEVDSLKYDLVFNSTLDKMKVISYDNKIFNSDRNKCRSCGYRHLCERFVQSKLY